MFINNYIRILIILIFLLSLGGVNADDGSLQVKNGLYFDKTFHNFNTVTMGKKVTVSFKFKNTSDKLIKVTNVSTICGCTVARLKKIDYAPDELGWVTVTLDTTFKQGLIIKTITLNTDNIDQKEIELSIAANVELPPHPLEKSINILKSSQCRLCHIDAARKYDRDDDGGYIYNAICWQCHGNNTHPPMTTNLINKNFLNARTDEQLYRSIAYGDINNGMPAYLDEKGIDGLTIKQIKSVVEYLRTKEQQ